MRFKVSFELEDEVESAEEFAELIEDLKYTISQYYDAEDFEVEEI